MVLAQACGMVLLQPQEPLMDYIPQEAGEWPLHMASWSPEPEWNRLYSQEPAGDD